MTFLDYSVTEKPVEESAIPAISNEVALSMQERLNARLNNTAPQNPQSQMAQPVQNEGFGRTV